MSATNDFDERARRKLAEREHAFDESAWQALRPELDAMRDQKRRRRFVLWFMVFAFLGAAGWILSPTESDGPIVERSPEPERDPGMVTIEDTTPSPTTTSTATASNAQPAWPPPAASTPAPQSPAEPQSATEERPKISHVQEGARTSDQKPLTKNKAAAQATVALVPDKTQGTGSEATANSGIPRDGTLEAPSTAAKDSTEVIAKPEEVTAGTPPPSAGVEPPPSTVVGDTMSIVTAITRDTLQYVIAMDSTFIADSTVAVMPPAPRSRLELSVWGGPFSTSTRYSGDRTTDWASTINKTGSVAFGAELMRQGEHFGLGAGLHYTTYVEQLNAESLKDELRTTVTTYQLNGIDTTVLVVNGTVWISGQQYYMTQMLDTTIYVLVGTDSEVVSTNVRRNALARSNRTSYLEIPLLFDAHLRRGHWGFSLRGGPTLGIVQGRRGVLPTSSGYTDLSDEAFSELVIGYTIQGHIRYHFGEAWSLGIGPALRGQLSNTLQGVQLQRRANAAGAVVTVGYRHP